MFFCLRSFREAKSSISFCLSIFLASAFSIERMANPSSLSCDIFDLRYVLINFSFENDHSAVGTVTGIVLVYDNHKVK